MKLFQQLNNDQLDGLARLCFDLAKAAFLLAIFPAVEVSSSIVISLLKMLIALLLGLVFTYIALVLLKRKEL